ncbi:MAG: hypothetical protein U0797_02370 [Gemmataceae bacterium]
MLAPQELELLTAHVDGELSAVQRRQVDSLLQRSGEARDTLQRLEADAARLRRLPRVSIPVDLSAGVLEEIGRLAQRPSRKARPVPARTLKFPAWAGFAAAAAVLVAVGAVSFLLNSPRDDSVQGGGGLVGIGVEKDKGIIRTPDKGAVAKTGQDKEGKGKSVAKAPPPDEKGKAGPEKVSNKSTTQAPPGGILAAGGGDERPKLERVERDLPTVAFLHELHKEEAAKALTGRLAKLNTARIELTAKDVPRAFERLRAALQARKITPHIDPAALARLKKTLVKSDVVVFIETLTAEDVVALLREAGASDREEPRFHGPVVVKEIARWDHKDLTDVLGIDPIKNRPAPPQKSGVDIRRELAEQTAREVVASLDGQGVPRPGAEPAHHAYISHLPASKARPAELKRFLDLRQPPRPGTLQVLLLVVRHVG